MTKKPTQYDVDMSAEIAEKAMQAAVFSVKRAKVLKIGAQKIKSDFNKSKKQTKNNKSEKSFTFYKIK